MDQHVATPGKSAEESAQLRWVHPTGLISLSFANYVLSLITLGIYSFWGKTEVRKRIWSAIRLEGEPLLYTGTGKELFLGFLFVFFLVVLPVMLVPVAASLLLGEGSVAAVLFNIGFYILLLFLVGVAVYRATRYRLSRTRWRGIRGALVGSPTRFALFYFLTLPLLFLSLGWIAPWRTTKLQSMLINDMRFGDRPFRFTATPGPLYSRFAIIWLSGLLIALLASVVLVHVFGSDALANIERDATQRITITTVLVAYAIVLVGFLLYGIASAWYYAFQFNHFARHTHFEGARLSAHLSGAGLIGLTITNLLISIISLGILSPVVQARTMRYVVQRLGFVGKPNFSEIAQAAAQDIRLGEGLAQAFDIDAF